MQVSRESTLTLSPKYFGKNLAKSIERELKRRYEGTIDAKYGFIIHIYQLLDYGQGKLDPDTGDAEFNVKYDAIVFKVFRHEIVPCRVSQVTPNGLFATAGTLEIFISEKLMPSDLQYSTLNGVPSFVSTEEEVTIKQNSEIRVKIVGIRAAAQQIVVIGTIKEDFLG